MFFSMNPADVTRALAVAAGFTELAASVEPQREGSRDVCYLWFLGCRSVS
jgi:hypothetical protein